MTTNITVRSLVDTLQQVAPGLHMGLPAEAKLSPVDLGGAPYDVAMTLDLTAEGIRPMSITITAAEGSPPITGTTLRALRVWDLFRAAIVTAVYHTFTEPTADGGTVITIFADLTDERRELIRLRGPVPDSLRWAAYFYNLGQLAGLSPVGEVMAGLGLPRSTATKWIRRARDLGLIEERNTPDGIDQ